VLGEGVLEQTVSGTQPARDGNRNPRMAPHGVFRCAGEQRWVAIAVRSDEEFRRCAEVMEQPELAADPRFASLPARKANEDALEAALSAWTVTLRAEEVAERLQRAGLAASVSMHSQDLAEDAHLAASGFFVQLPHREVGTRLHLGMPWQMSDTACAVRQAAPCLGEQTDDVLHRIVGYSADHIAALRERGVLT